MVYYGTSMATKNPKTTTASTTTPTTWGENWEGNERNPGVECFERVRFVKWCHLIACKYRQIGTTNPLAAINPSEQACMIVKKTGPKHMPAAESPHGKRVASANEEKVPHTLLFVKFF
mmetsp:Transcript_7877/g.15045  ORF Transcript_7877/g.15045 Transcript_7877/m.15045 type:complete len:118 (+) Transcript_7877:59-412(+)